MADDICYNYPAMETASDNMSNYHKQINDTCTSLMETGNRVIAGADAAFVDEYHKECRDLHKLLDEFNTEFGSNIKKYQHDFEAMRQLDGSLAGQF